MAEDDILSMELHLHTPLLATSFASGLHSTVGSNDDFLIFLKDANLFRIQRKSKHHCGFFSGETMQQIFILLFLMFSDCG